MGDVTKIEWCDHTFNPWVGCTKVAPGCVNCYAEADMDKRRHFALWGPNGTRIRTSPANWKKALKWNRDAACTCDKPLGQSSMEAFATCPQHRPSGRPRVFCASLADVFEDWAGQPQMANGQWVIKRRENGVVKELVGCNLKGGNDAATLDDVRRELFQLIDATPNLDWLLLTKRPENILRMWPRVGFPDAGVPGSLGKRLYLKNVQLGTSISDQATADAASHHLLKCRDLCPVLFVSAEPLLGPVDLRCVQSDGLVEIDALTGDHGVNRPLAGRSSARLDWVIVGGESGHNARQCQIEWVRSLVTQCDETGVACFVKQLGAKPCAIIQRNFACFGPEWLSKSKDKKGAAWLEWPEDLRVRQFPRLESAVTV